MRWLPYAAAILAVGAATIMSVPLASNVALLILIHFAAVAVAGWCGGLGPALLATVLGYVVVNWFFVAPQDAFTPNPTAFVYFFVCLAIGAFSEVSKRALCAPRPMPSKSGLLWRASPTVLSLSTALAT